MILHYFLTILRQFSNVSLNLQSHTAEYLKDRLLHVLSIYNIDISRVHTITTDGAANMIAAVRLLNVKNIHCIAHIINLTVQSALDISVRALAMINDVHDIVTYFKQNLTAQAELEREQDKTPPFTSLKLVQSVPTRWNSSLDMVERFLQLSNEVAVVLVKRDRTDMIISKANLEVLHEIVTVLKPFKVNLCSITIIIILNSIN